MVAGYVRHSTSSWEFNRVSRTCEGGPFPDAVYVLTPNGDVLEMPKGASAVDVAYAIHTDVGKRCVGCRINKRIAPLRTQLETGDQVEMLPPGS